jgi:putative transposase
MSHRYRIKLEEGQDEVMLRHCSDARFIWNLACEQQIFARKYGRKSGREKWPKHVEQSRELTGIRQQYDWLREGATTVQQGALRDFDQAMKNRFKNPDHFGYPKFRSSKSNQGFIVRDVKIRKLNRKWSEVLIPKLGYVKFRVSRPLPEGHGHGRVTLNKAGQWHISFASPQPVIEREITETKLGLDLGVVNTVTDSNGNFYRGPKPKCIKYLQRKMSRQTYGSKRYIKTKQRKALIEQRNSDSRKDFHEKLSTNLVKNNDILVFEKLDIKKMTKKGLTKSKRRLNQLILQQCWGYLVRRCEQKAATCGVTVLRINPAFTSQKCSMCGFTDEGNRENQADFKCLSCDFAHNADVNAAINILAAGLAVLERGDLRVKAQISETLPLEHDIVIV